MRPMQPPLADIVVEYDVRRRRRQKHFTDAYRARSFYSAKLNAGKNPKVLRHKETTDHA